MPKYTEYELRDASKVMGLEGFFAKELLVAYARIAELEGALIDWAKEERKSGQPGFSSAPLLRLMHMSKKLLDQAESADARGGEKL